MIGALGDGAPDLQFHDGLSAGSYELVERLRRRYGKVDVIADNASALTGREMRGCLDGAGGDVEMLHLPPHTPQLDPIGAEWREIKAAVAGIFFDCLEKMRDAIRRMIRNGEMPMVKMLDGCWPHSGPTHLCTITGTEAARTSRSFTNRHAGGPAHAFPAIPQPAMGQHAHQDIPSFSILFGGYYASHATTPISARNLDGLFG